MSADLTARARIRASAMLLFGSNGYAHTSVREIASHAGVSPALVIHHFGSKHKLRVACDDYVLELVARKAGKHGDAPTAAVQRAIGELAALRPVMDYLATMVTDGTAGGDELFDRLLAETREVYRVGVDTGSMKTNSDPDMLAAILVIYGLAPLLLHRQLARVFGADTIDSSLSERMALPSLELFTNGLYADGSMLDAARFAFAHRNAATRPEPDNREDRH